MVTPRLAKQRSPSALLQHSTLAVTGAPGAQQVQGRAVGQIPEWARRMSRQLIFTTRSSQTNSMHVIVEGNEEESSRNAETDANVESVISPIPGENPLPEVNGTIIEERLASSFKLWTFVLLNFVWAMIVVGVVVGVIVKRQNRKVPAPLSGSGIQLIPMEFQGPCGLQGKEAFNVRLQCDCQDTISFVLEESFALYKQLTTAVFQTVRPFSYSCHLANLALWNVITNMDEQIFDYQVFYERYVLTVIYLEWSGDEWIENNNFSWLDYGTECKWYGVICNENGTVIGFEQKMNGLTGSIPTELALLHTLEVIYLDGEDNIGFGGSLPSELAQLPRLSVFICSNCKLTGTIPKELWNHPTLTTLSLELNKLTGSIPVTVGESILLKINLTQNALIGTILSDIGQLGSSLKVLNLNRNQLNGLIPEEVGLLSLLTVLNLGENDLSPQRLPDWIWGLTPLTVLNLNGLHLTGTIPTFVGNLSQLQKLTVAFNKLSGTIPTEIGILTILTLLFFGNNKFSGKLPSELGLLTNLLLVGGSVNSFTGTLPSELSLLEFASKFAAYSL